MELCSPFVSPVTARHEFVYFVLVTNGRGDKLALLAFVNSLPATSFLSRA